MRPIDTDELGSSLATQAPESLWRVAIDGIGDMSEASYLAGAGDTSTTVALNSAEFALLSSGPDGRLNQDIRYDNKDDPGNHPYGGRATSFANEDNIVELGP